MSAPESCKVKDSTAVVKACEVNRLTIPITFLWSIYDDSYIYLKNTPKPRSWYVRGIYFLLNNCQENTFSGFLSTEFL